MKRACVPAALALLFACSDAAADSDIERNAKTALLLDGTWSVTTQYNALIVDRGVYSSNWASGLVGTYARRALYGTSWSLMVGGIGAAAVLTSGIDWIGAASYRVDLMVPLDLPECPHTGANAGCGLGTGGFSFLQVKPRGSHWWLEVGGGSFDQRVLNDALREVGESTWVLTPMTALREFATRQAAPVSLKWQVGPGVYGGMLNGTMHPTARGEDVYKKRPWTELYPLYGGVGPGARTELAFVFGHHIALEGDLTVAPFVVGAATAHPAAAVAPLDVARHGMPVWRKLDAGVGYVDERAFKVTAQLFASELSGRRLDHAGYRGAMLRFDIPLRLGEER